MGKSTVHRIVEDDPIVPRRPIVRKATKFCPEVLEQVCENLARGVDQTTAALTAGITWHTVAMHARRDPDVRAQLEAAAGRSIARVAEALFDSAVGTNGKPSVQAQIAFLSRRGGAAWRDQTDVEVTSQGESIGDILRGAVMDAISPEPIPATIVDVDTQDDDDIDDE